MRWIHHFLLRLAPYRRFTAWSKTYILPGFYPIPLYRVAAFLLHEITQSTILNRASSLAFNFMLAFFPATIFLFTLIPFIPIHNFQGQLLNLLSTILPYNAYMAFQSTIEYIVRIHNLKLLSFGFVAALYFATSGFSNLMQAFNTSALAIKQTRSWLRRRVIAIALTVVISLLLLFAITVMIAGEAIISYLKSHIDSRAHFWYYVIAFSRWVIVIAIFFISISILYRYGPENKVKWKFLNIGAIMATALAVVTSMGFSYYINNFASYNKVYGSLGTLIILMLWLYLNCLILLIGFELNASIEFSKRNIKIAKPMFNSFRHKAAE